MNEAMRLERDRDLRRSMLRYLHDCRGVALGGLTASVLLKFVDGMRPVEERTEDEAHGLALLADLEAKGLILVTDLRKHPKQEARTLSVLFARITDKGASLVREAIPMDPDVRDDREPEPLR